MALTGLPAIRREQPADDCAREAQPYLEVWGKRGRLQAAGVRKRGKRSL